MEYYSAIKRNNFESVVMRWMSLEPVIQSEIRKRKISYINAYIWNLEKQYGWAYLQGRNGDADTENGLADTAGEGEDGMDWASCADI